MQKHKGFLAAIFGAALFSSASFAAETDRALLDLLVSKDTITREEADAVSKNLSVVTMGRPETRKLEFWGMAQMQYNYVYGERGDFSNTDDGFNLRRLYLGFRADITESIKASLVLDFMRKGTNGSDYLLDAFVTKKFDGDYLNGNLHFGIKKVQFIYEENISSTKLPTVDTSIATRYLGGSQKYSNAYGSEGRVGFGQRYLGLFWDGKVPQVEGLKYYLAVTNSMNNTINPSTHLGNNSSNPTADDSLAYWLTLDYSKKIGDFNARAGVKTGYAPGGNVAGRDKYGSILGINPFLELKYKRNTTLWAEYILTDIQYGKNRGMDRATPMALNIGGEYRFDIGRGEQLGLVARFSQVFSDGRGMTMKDTVPNSQGSYHNSGQTVYDRAMSVYAGLNWYISKDDLKVQLGYEWLKFENPIRNFGGIAEDGCMSAVRLQVQVIF